jgi:hypothetical protein
MYDKVSEEVRPEQIRQKEYLCMMDEWEMH